MKKISNEQITILVVCIALCMTIGNEYGDMAIGAAIGSGLGVILMFTIGKIKSNKDKE